MVETAIYSNQEHTQIRLGELLIPVDMHNRDYCALIKEEVLIVDYVSPPEFVDANAAIYAMVQWIDEFTVSITGEIPIGEKLAWSNKEAAAIATIEGIATTQQTDMLQSEAVLTGEEVLDLATTIKAKASAYRHIAGMISGLRRKTEAALLAVTDDTYQYEVILAAAKVEAGAMIAGLSE